MTSPVIFNPSRTSPQTPGFRAINPMTGAPPTGLIGAENALTSSANSAIRGLQSSRNLGLADIQGASTAGIQALQQGGQRGIGFLSRGMDGFNPLAAQGGAASGIQAALSGAMGVQSQRDALANMKPVSDFLVEQGERALTRNSSALGGLGGGNVRRELLRFGQGLAGESAQQQFNNLGVTADRGFNALSNMAGLSGQQASMAQSIGQGSANILGAEGQQLAGLRHRTAGDIANIAGSTGSQLAAGRSRAGERIASSIGSTTSGLSNLINQQGGAAANTLGATGGNIANLLSGIGQQTGLSQERLGELLANISTGSATGPQASLAQFNNTQGNAQAVGNFASAVGGVIGVSDRRLKTNIQQVGALPSGLNVYTWDWTKEGQRIAGNAQRIGVIAQEVQDVMPSAVTEHESGYLMVNYGALV